MEIRQLIYFRAIIKTGGFGAAAELCSVSQPSLSQQIKKLEEQLGETLIIRARNGCQLTSAGKLLWERAHPLLERWESTERMFTDELKDSQISISLGVIPTIAPYLLPDKIRQFRIHLPEVKIDLSEDKTEILLQQILTGEIRFAICSHLQTVPSGITAETIFHEPLLAVVPKEEKRDRHQITYTELLEQTLLLLKEGHCLSSQTIRQCREYDFRTSGAIRCEHLETLVGMIEANLGIGIFPQMTAHSYRTRNVDFCEVSDKNLTRQITIISRTETVFTAAEKLMIQILIDKTSYNT